MIISPVPRLFNIEVARGEVPGYQQVIITGLNPDVGSSFEDLWDVGGDFVFPTAAETWEILSDNVNDTSAGTGARTVLIQGLDTDYVEQQEVITMNGTSTVTTVRTDWFRITALQVISSGSNQANVGNITIQVLSGGLIRSKIRAGRGQTHNGFFTVPKDKSLLIQSTQLVIPKNEDVIARSKVLIDGTNTFITGNDLPVYQNTFTTFFTAIPTLPEKTDIVFTAKSTNTSVNVALLVEGVMANISMNTLIRGM